MAFRLKLGAGFAEPIQFVVPGCIPTLGQYRRVPALVEAHAAAGGFELSIQAGVTLDLLISRHPPGRAVPAPQQSGAAATPG